MGRPITFTIKLIRDALVREAPESWSRSVVAVFLCRPGVIVRNAAMELNSLVSTEMRKF